VKIAGERERIEEKGYGEREKRLRDEDKEGRRKRVRKKERKKRKIWKKEMNCFFINYVLKIILIKLLLGNWI
jgi:hypothetical protein